VVATKVPIARHTSGRRASEYGIDSTAARLAATRLPPTAQRAAAAGAPARHPWLVAVRMLGELP
jgi:hypothetical protein